MRFSIAVVLVFLSWASFSQDTLRLMHYNLLNYGNNYGDCNSSNNNVDDKNEYLKVLVGYIQPDLLTVNEIDENDNYHDKLLDNVFNTNGNSDFSRAEPPNLGYSPIMNQAYYNHNKLKLLSNQAIETNYRDIDVFNFLVLGSAAEDSIRIHCLVAHLKAGSDPEDLQERASETYKLMNYLNNNDLDGNVILAGDFNIRAASESSFQNLIAHPNESIRFFDPINKAGSWHDNPDYAQVHTQSSHLSSGCPSGGGMDDRFDFILVQEEILLGTEYVQYVPGSYTAIGQDGQRLNMSLKNPSNNSVPADVINALFDMSDHLPVVADLAVGTQIGGINRTIAPLAFTCNNPASGTLRMLISQPQAGDIEIRISDLFGRIVSKQDHSLSDGSAWSLPVSNLPNGLYLIQLIHKDFAPSNRKILIYN